MRKKQSLRAHYLVLRKKMKKEEVLQKSRIIFEKVSSLGVLSNAKTISAYLPINNEVETKELIAFCLGKNMRVFVPKFADHKWTFSEFKSWKKLEKGPFGISQPIGSTVKKVDFDVVILPGVAFDGRGVRLGYGKGVFDKLLTNSRAVKIGLCYDFQMVDELPKEKHDLVMDIVVGESRIIELN